MPIDLTKAAIRLAPAVEFSWNGGAGVARYVRAGAALTIGGDVYSPIPALELRFTKAIDGGVKDSPLEIKMPASLLPISNMIAHQHAMVDVTVMDVDLDDLANPRIVWLGRVTRTVSRPEGQSKLVQVTVSGRKQWLDDVTYGPEAIPECIWTFGDTQTCKFNLVSQIQSATLSAITGERVTMGGLTGHTADNRFERGWVEKDGLRILVTRHANTALLVLAYPPPPTWLVGDTVSVAPGCNKTVVKCSFWGRNESFMGLGYSMPNHHPLIENRP